MEVFLEALRRGPTQPTLQAVQHRIAHLEQQLMADVLLAHERHALDLELEALRNLENICRMHIRAFYEGVPDPLALYTENLLQASRQSRVFADVSNGTVLVDDGRPGRNDPVMQYEILECLHKNYDDAASREVFRAVDLTGGRLVVLKKLSKAFLQDLSPQEQMRKILSLRREFIVQVALQAFEHPNVLCFEKYFENQSDIYALMPHADESVFDLAPNIRDVGVLHSIFSQMAAAVDFLVGLGFVHRDLKLENFVVFHQGDQNVRVQMIDFGWTTALRIVDPAQPTATYHQESQAAGTFAFMAPEVFRASPSDTTRRPQPYDPIAAEVWSLGVCFFALGSLAQPYKAPHLFDKGYLRIYQRGASNALYHCRSLLERANVRFGVIFQNQRLVTLVNRMMVSNPASRISMLGILQELEHPLASISDAVAGDQVSAAAGATGAAAAAGATGAAAAAGATEAAAAAGAPY